MGWEFGIEMVQEDYSLDLRSSSLGARPVVSVRPYLEKVGQRRHEDDREVYEL